MPEDVTASLWLSKTLAMKYCLAITILLIHTRLAVAQHDMAGMNMHTNAGSPAMQMTSALSRSLPFSRDGSGTGWLPDASPVYAYMANAGKWMCMFGGDIFPRYNSQDISKAGSRGAALWDAPDMLMAMAQQKTAGKGILRFSLMMSADAVITGGNGYPLLFQTGESWQGKPLVDRQHPHDLFSELSASYSWSFNRNTDAYVYIGYPGEPALGPVTFMHRPSGRFIPDAPIGHHWEDATHITFGVTTLGIRYRKFKIEGSSFTGREPGENRYNFDKPTFDSWSSRLSFNPSSRWALQASYGYLKSPEALHPLENIGRFTASAIYTYPIAQNKYFTSTLLFGQNRVSGQDNSNAWLADGALKISKATCYIRYENVQKTAEELALDYIYAPSIKFAVNAITAGFAYDLLHIAKATIAAGAQVSICHTVTQLSAIYGENPLSGEIYLHIYPPLMHQ
jgi:hypothetical protein